MTDKIGRVGIDLDTRIERQQVTRKSLPPDPLNHLNYQITSFDHGTPMTNRATSEISDEVHI